MKKVVVIDDNRELARILASELTRRGYAVEIAHTGQEGLALVAASSPRLVFLDLRLPDQAGVDVLGRIRTSGSNVDVVIMTGYPHLSTALAALKKQAVDYLCKPFTFEEVDPILARVFEPPEPEPRPFRSAPSGTPGRIEMIGPSQASRALRTLAGQLAASGVRAVLVMGESGTGKELVAGLLHAEGPRRDGPFVEVNCSAISETLFESELFGHERGAFTGAVGSRRGLCEAADGGTLFLDEIGDMPVSCQAKLLRFLDDQTFLRVGGSRKVRVNVQIVAATNRDLRAMVAEGTFRGDLYYRLNVAPVALTPLRSRPDDILPLAYYWLRRVSAEHGDRVKGLTPDAEQRLLAHSWPGNVRELRNLMERMVILCPGDWITAEQLPEEIGARDAATAPAAAFIGEMERARAGLDPDDTLAEVECAAAPASLDELGRAHIRRVLSQVNGNKTKAAALLGISRQTLRSKLGSL
jgi:DNA-binding NtrC family response regulator